MARRRNRRNALHEGLMGAVLGGLQFQMAEHTRRQLEEADLRKEERLAAREAANAERNHQYAMARDSAQADRLDARTGQAQQHQLDVLSRTQEFTASENEANRAVQREGHAVTAQNARLSAERNADYQTYVDETGQIHRLPLNAEGDARLSELQGAGRKLQLMEGSRGGRFSALPAAEGAGAGPSGAGGAGSVAPAPGVPAKKATDGIAFDFIDGMLRPVR